MARIHGPNEVSPAETRAVHFNGVKVFSATMLAQRAGLGEVVTDWFKQNDRLDIVDIVVSQSSDSRFHCIALTVFFSDERHS